MTTYRPHSLWLPAVIALGMICQSALAQTTLFRHPAPGSIYRDYVRELDRYSNEWRVTDDFASASGAQVDLPNATLYVDIGDLTDAIKAELVIDVWGGHAGTTGKSVKFNSSPTIPIPELQTTPGSGECYVSQPMIVIDVPLNYIHEGTNSFRGYTTGQTCNDFGWGTWGWHGVILRVYYGSGKAHATGQITSHANGGTLQENPTISVLTSGGADRVDVLGYYYGYDTDGDGIFTDWHYDYHRAISDQMKIQNHVGTANGSGPTYNVNWNTTAVPDQDPGSMKLVSRIRNSSGVWFVSDVVEALTLNRTQGSVRLYHTNDVPPFFQVRDNNTMGCNVNVASTSGASIVKFLVRTWNGANDAGDPPGHYTRMNGWSAPQYGAGHYYSYDILDVPTSEVNAGNNYVEFWANSDHHGIELLWPGPAVLVTYDAPVPIQISAFQVLAYPESSQVVLRWSTLSETNNYGFEVQRSLINENSYETLPGGFVAGAGTTIEPRQYRFVDHAPYAGVAYYRLKQIDLDRNVYFYGGNRVDFVTNVTENQVPAHYILSQNYPNPFNPSTVIGYGMPAAGLVTIRLYNQLGQEVRMIVNAVMGAGVHEAQLNADGLTSGIYFYRMQTGSFTQTKRLVLLR